MLKKVAKEAALAAPPVGVSAGVIAGLTLQQWACVLTIIYTMLLIARALGFPVNKVLPQLYRCGVCMVRYRRCSGSCHMLQSGHGQ